MSLETTTTFFLKKNADNRFVKPNEDYIICNFKDCLFIIADGVTREIVNNIYPNPSPASEVSKLFCDFFNSNWSSSYNEGDIKNNMIKVAKEANKKLHKYNKYYKDNSRNFEPAGTVAIIAHIFNNKLHLIYNGDCGCILIRDNNIIQLSKSQTKLVIENRQNLSRYEIRNNIVNNKQHPMSFGVYNGDERVIEFIEYNHFDLLDNDIIIIYSDGCEPAINELSTNHLIHYSAKSIVLKSEEIEIEKKIRSDDKSLIKIKYRSDETTSGNNR